MTQSSIKLSEYALMLSNAISNGGDKPITMHLLPEHMRHRLVISRLIHRCICLNPAAETLDEMSMQYESLSDYAQKANAEIAALKAKIAAFESAVEAAPEKTKRVMKSERSKKSDANES